MGSPAMGRRTANRSSAAGLRGAIAIAAVALWAAPAAAQPFGPPPLPATEGRPLDEKPLAAPFELAPKEAAYLDQVLAAWEKETTRIKTFRCTFTRWEYVPGFLPAQFKDQPGLESDGELKYSAPDKGTFKINVVRRLNPQSGKFEPAADEIGEHWVCNGESIWEYNAKLKQVIERPIPPEMRGRAISDGPLPFLFGAEAEKLKRRYFLRIITPQQYAQAEIWIDGYPRFRHDAANFQRAILRLKRSNFEPYALRIYDPGDRYTSYEFQQVKINDPFEKIRDIFAPPRVPFGWKKVRELPQQAAGNSPERNGASRR